jgi:alcohol dehydrogenase/propanol-preferring alcohol dehydrogenase
MLLKERGVTLPRAVGHEIFGRVAKLGPDATGVAVGDRRIVYPWLGCGKCRRCLAENDNLCANQRSLGVVQNGGFASHVLVPHPRYLVDPGQVDPAVAATFSCSGITVLSAIRKAMPSDPDDPILLIGAGGLGLQAIAVLLALGHRAIITVDLDAQKRSAALAAGATHVVDASAPNVVAAIREAAGGPVLAAIDFVGATVTAVTCYDALAKGGKLVQVGIFGGEFTVSLVGLVMRAVSVIGNNTGSIADLREVTALANAGKLAPIPITRMAKDDANAAMMRLRDGLVTGRIVLTADAG